MDFFQFTTLQWLLAGLAALLVGLSKSGFGGVGTLVVVLMATVMHGHEKESTGVVLPMLIIGDMFAVRVFHMHAKWAILKRLLAPAAVGVVIGWLLMDHISNVTFRPLIGGMVIVLTLLHLLHRRYPERFQAVPHSAWFAWAMGITAGATTMLANAAGPVMALFFLALALPKMELVATGAVYFLIMNLFKVPFSWDLGFITGKTLLFNAMLAPLVALGIFGGRFLLHRINQTLFEQILIGMTIFSALFLILR